MPPLPLLAQLVLRREGEDTLRLHMTHTPCVGRECLLLLQAYVPTTCAVKETTCQEEPASTTMVVSRPDLSSKHVKRLRSRLTKGFELLTRAHGILDDSHTVRWVTLPHISGYQVVAMRALTPPPCRGSMSPSRS